ncbi:MAG: histidine kinase dimerization/phosphoacceptor domain -containing protein [Ferruginibacter sp.]
MQNRVKKSYLLLSILFYPAFYIVVFSQYKPADLIIATRYLTPTDGIASREIFCALQDEEGFMWFGTRNGLNRYDGKNFRLFSKQNNGLAENKVIQLAKDNNKHLFIVYGNPGYARSAMRIDVMDLNTHKLKSLKETFPNLPFNEDYVYWIANGGDDLCFLVANPFQYWRLTSKGFEMKLAMKSWDMPGIPKENWLTANGKHHTTTGPSCQFYKDCALLRLSDSLPQYFCTAATSAAIKFSEGRLINPDKQLAFIPTGLSAKPSTKASDKKRIDTATPFLKGEVSYLVGDFSNALIYTAKDGLYLYDHISLNRLLMPDKLNISDGYGLNSYFIDNQNNIWICTSGGLIKIKMAKNLFLHYFTRQQSKDSADHQVRGIYADEVGNVYGAVWTKFYYHNSHSDGFSKIGKDNIIYGLCRCMNKIYAGEANIYSFEADKEKVLKRLTAGNLKEIWSIDSLAPDKLLVGSTEGILTFNIPNNSFAALSYSSDQIPKAKFIYRFIKRKDRKIWAVAQNGLYELNENADTVTDYFGKGSPDSSHRLPFEILDDAYEDNAGIFWFATNGEGLFRWDSYKKTRMSKQQAFRQFNSADGLPSDILYRIESDEENNLWISTDNGLMRFNTKNYSVHTYLGADGISHNEFNRASSFKANDGRLFFGGLDGINAFYPKQFTGDSSQFNIPLRLISFNQFIGSSDRLIDKTSELIQQNKITLNPGDKFFTLEFQLLDFEESSRYAYMIAGVDKEWNYINENSIRISGLPYGNFNLHIKAQNFKGAWSKNELTIPVNVVTPFYKTWFFYFIILFVLIVLIYGFMYFRTRTLEKANARLEEIVGKRTLQLQDSLNQKDVLLKEIHHRVKNNLQIISSMLELQAANAEDDLLKQALIEGQTRVRSIALIHHRLYENESLGEIEFGGFLKDLYKQVAAVFQKSEQQAEPFYDVPETNFDIDTIVPLGLLVNELFTNSFKYAFGDNQPGKIWMQMAEPQKKNYIFTYKDSGPGLPEGFDIQKASSLGLRLIYRLGKQLGGNVLYDQKENTFTIKFTDSLTRKQDE